MELFRVGLAVLILGNFEMSDKEILSCLWRNLVLVASYFTTGLTARFVVPLTLFFSFFFFFNFKFLCMGYVPFV